MPADRSRRGKQDALRQHATRNPRPDGVTHTLFESSEFFDPDDLLQVKYEMLRLVHLDKRPISEAAKACGFSRPTAVQDRRILRLTCCTDAGDGRRLWGVRACAPL